MGRRFRVPVPSPLILSPDDPPAEILPGCHRIPLPDPFPPGAVCVFLLDGGDGPWLADAGPPGDDARRALDDGLTSLDTGRETVEGVLVSHVHLDHVGGLRGWRPRRLVLHADAARSLGRRDAEDTTTLLRRMGVPGEHVDTYREYREPRDPELAASLRPDLRLEGDTGELTAPGGWRWLRVGGHAAGHLLLFEPDRRHLLAFDQFLGRLKTPLRLDDAAADPWGDYLRSLERAEALEPEVIHPSHAEPIRPAVPWLRRRRRILERQLERVAEAVEAGASTAWEVADRAYPGAQGQGPGRRALLLREVLAALRHLAATGRARRERAEGIERYAVGSSRGGTEGSPASSPSTP